MAGRSGKRRLGVRNAGSGKKQVCESVQDSKSVKKTKQSEQEPAVAMTSRNSRKRARNEPESESSGVEGECEAPQKKVTDVNSPKKNPSQKMDSVKKTSTSCIESSASLRVQSESSKFGKSSKIVDKHESQTRFKKGEKSDENVCTCTEISLPESHDEVQNMDFMPHSAHSSECVPTKKFYGQMRACKEVKKTGKIQGKLEQQMEVDVDGESDQSCKENHATTSQSTQKTKKKFFIPEAIDESPKPSKTLYTKTARKLLEKLVFIIINKHIP